MIINGGNIERGPFEWWQQCGLKKHQLSKLNLGVVSSGPNLELYTCPSHLVRQKLLMLASRDLKPMRRKSDAIVWRPNTTDRRERHRNCNSLTTGARPTRDHGITLIRKNPRSTPLLHPLQGKNTPPYLADPNFKPMKNESKLSCNTDASLSNTTPFCAAQCFNLWMSWNAILVEISNQLALRTFLYTYFMQ